MHASLNVNREGVGAECCKVTDVTVWSLNHEMDIQWLFGVLSDGCNDRHTITDVRDEHAIHDVDVVPVRLTPLYHLNISREVSKISGQQRRSDEM